MHFKVRGVRKDNGKDIERIYEARTEEAVALLARDDGILIEEILLSAPAEGEIDFEPPKRSAPRVSPVKSQAPLYNGLTIAGGILRIYGFLCYLLGALLLIPGIIGLFGNRFERAEAMFGVATALATLLAGGFAHGAGAACIALRDIARNSWKWAT